MSIALKDAPLCGFDYLALRPEQRAVAVGAAQRVRLHAERGRESLAAIGHELDAAKRSLGHGLFLRWLAAEFPEVSDDTAADYMNLARVRSRIPPEAEYNFTLTGLYAMGRRGVPPGAKEALIARAAAGERITEATVRGAAQPAGTASAENPGPPPRSPPVPAHYRELREAIGDGRGLGDHAFAALLADASGPAVRLRLAHGLLRTGLASKRQVEAVARLGVVA